MSEDLSPEFSRLLDQYDEKRRGVEARKLQVQADQDAFQEGFARIKTAVVRPAFEAVGVLLKDRGHGFDISEQEYAIDPAGKATEADLTLRITPAGIESPKPGEAQLFSLSFSTRQYNRTVWIRGSNTLPLTGGSKKDYQLAEIDRELVQTELLRLITGMVNR
jgi:hypothetical protein